MVVAQASGGVPITGAFILRAALLGAWARQGHQRRLLVRIRQPTRTEPRVRWVVARLGVLLVAMLVTMLVAAAWVTWRRLWWGEFLNGGRQLNPLPVVLRRQRRHSALTPIQLLQLDPPRRLGLHTHSHRQHHSRVPRKTLLQPRIHVSIYGAIAIPPLPLDSHTTESKMACCQVSTSKPFWSASDLLDSQRG